MNFIKKIFGGSNKDPIIRSIDVIYNQLKNNNIDKDEHWLLINTWITRYGDWEIAKQKGKEWAEFVAYKDTFIFSFLDFPDSIRGLSLYLAYKELGEEEIGDKDEELSQLVYDACRIQENGSLLNVYKIKNPFMWNRVQSENEFGKYSLFGFLKAADHLNNNPVAREEAERILKRIDNTNDTKS